MLLCWEAQRASQRPTAERGPRPASARRAPPRPGRNLGLGQEFGPVAYPPWASSGPKPRASLRAVGLNPTVLRRFRPGKTGVAGQLPQTLNHFFSSLPFCPPKRRRRHDNRRRPEGGGGGARHEESHRRPPKRIALLFISCENERRRPMRLAGGERSAPLLAFLPFFLSSLYSLRVA